MLSNAEEMLAERERESLGRKEEGKHASFALFLPFAEVILAGRGGGGGVGIRV